MNLSNYENNMDSTHYISGTFKVQTMNKEPCVHQRVTFGCSSKVLLHYICIFSHNESNSAKSEMCWKCLNNVR